MSVLRDEALDAFVSGVIIQKLQETENQSVLFTLLQTIGIISRFAGQRVIYIYIYCAYVFLPHAHTCSYIYTNDMFIMYIHIYE